MHRRPPVGAPGRPLDATTRLGVLLVLVLAFSATAWATGVSTTTGAASGPVRLVAAAPVVVHRTVFAAPVRLGPGERRTAVVKVRNTRSTPSRVVVRLRARGVAPLIDGDRLRVLARVPGAGWRRVEAGPPYDVVRIDTLPPGARVPLRIRAQVPAAAGRPTNVRAADLDLRIVLARAYTAEELAALSRPDPDPQLELAPLFLGLGMATSGALALAVRSRRRRRVRRRWV